MTHHVTPAQALQLVRNLFRFTGSGYRVSRRFSTEHEDAYVIQNYDPATSPADPGREYLEFPLIVLKDGTVKDSRLETMLCFRYGLRGEKPVHWVTLRSVDAGREVAVARILGAAERIASAEALKIVRGLASTEGHRIRTRDEEHAVEILAVVVADGGNATRALAEMPVEMPSLGNPFMDIDDSVEVELPPTRPNGWQLKSH